MGVHEFRATVCVSAWGQKAQNPRRVERADPQKLPLLNAFAATTVWCPVDVRGCSFQGQMFNRPIGFVGATSRLQFPRPDRTPTIGYLTLELEACVIMLLENPWLLKGSLFVIITPIGVEIVFGCRLRFGLAPEALTRIKPV